MPRRYAAMADQDMIDRDQGSYPEKLYDLAEKAVAKGIAKEAYEAIKPVVEPPPDTSNRGLGKTWE